MFCYQTTDGPITWSGGGGGEGAYNRLALYPGFYVCYLCVCFN